MQPTKIPGQYPLRWKYSLTHKCNNPSRNSLNPIIVDNLQQTQHPRKAGNTVALKCKTQRHAEVQETQPHSGKSGKPRKTPGKPQKTPGKPQDALKPPIRPNSAPTPQHQNPTQQNTLPKPDQQPLTLAQKTHKTANTQCQPTPPTKTHRYAHSTILYYPRKQNPRWPPYKHQITHPIKLYKQHNLRKLANSNQTRNTPTHQLPFTNSHQLIRHTRLTTASFAQCTHRMMQNIIPKQNSAARKPEPTSNPKPLAIKHPSDCNNITRILHKYVYSSTTGTIHKHIHSVKPKNRKSKTPQHNRTQPIQPTPQTTTKLSTLKRYKSAFKPTELNKPISDPQTHANTRKKKNSNTRNPPIKTSNENPPTSPKPLCHQKTKNKYVIHTRANKTQIKATKQTTSVAATARKHKKKFPGRSK
eukprot:gene2943-1925_t